MRLAWPPSALALYGTGTRVVNRWMQQTMRNGQSEKAPGSSSGCGLEGLQLCAGNASEKRLTISKLPLIEGGHVVLYGHRTVVPVFGNSIVNGVFSFAASLGASFLDTANKVSAMVSARSARVHTGPKTRTMTTPPPATVAAKYKSAACSVP